jgi:hypothetical protein
MKWMVILTAGLAFGIALGAQDAPQPVQPPQPQPIPNWDGNKPAAIEPIPSWIDRNPASYHTGTVVLSFVSIISPPCAVFVKNGKRFDYREGALPGAMKLQKQANKKTLRAIQKAGGTYRLLDHGATQDQIDAALMTCPMTVGAPKTLGTPIPLGTTTPK